MFPTSEVNEIIKDKPSEGNEEFTVEGIAETLGIGTKTLYQWAKNDTEFSTALERLKNVHEKDPFKTGTHEDSSIAAMTLALLLIETWDRHYMPTYF